MHRFKDDLEWRYILRRLREGNPTKADLQEINSYVVTKNTKLPNDLKYGARFNKVRDSVHCILFEKYISKQKTNEFGKVKDCVLVLCDKIKLQKLELMLQIIQLFSKILENLIVRCIEED